VCAPHDTLGDADLQHDVHDVRHGLTPISKKPADRAPHEGCNGQRTSCAPSMFKTARAEKGPIHVTESRRRKPAGLRRRSPRRDSNARCGVVERGTLGTAAAGYSEAPPIGWVPRASTALLASTTRQSTTRRKLITAEPATIPWACGSRLLPGPHFPDQRGLE